MARRICIAVAMAFAVLPAAPAAAGRFCVGIVSDPYCEQRFPELQPALDAAGASSEVDSITIGRTTQGSWTWDTAQGFHYSCLLYTSDAADE